MSEKNTFHQIVRHEEYVEIMTMTVERSNPNNYSIPTPNTDANKHPSEEKKKAAEFQTKETPIDYAPDAEGWYCKPCLRKK
ncbi:hypothetical protein QR680_008115 [Steinernema hermaphroditum]|uniref:Uncharacterized protein n=1 Tax=Steinernema hermaphroditum TaxID=289476 RepID=A0AA39M7H7_9BILA|nr:hypothetical protein QR680_008115 [Steinernema hermaphroditum]